MTIDADSTIIEVCGYHKQGASYGYTRKLGYHPLLATRADTCEVLHARLRADRANTARGMPRFVDEFIARTRRAGAAGELTLRRTRGSGRPRIDSALGAGTSVELWAPGASLKPLAGPPGRSRRSPRPRNMGQARPRERTLGV